MQMTRSTDTRTGPAHWFTGGVSIDAVAAPEATWTSAAAFVCQHVSHQQYGGGRSA